MTSTLQLFIRLSEIQQKQWRLRGAIIVSGWKGGWLLPVIDSYGHLVNCGEKRCVGASSGSVVPSTFTYTKLSNERHPVYFLSMVPYVWTPKRSHSCAVEDKWSVLLPLEWRSLPTDGSGPTYIPAPVSVMSFPPHPNLRALRCNTSKEWRLDGGGGMQIISPRSSTDKIVDRIGLRDTRDWGRNIFTYQPPEKGAVWEACCLHPHSNSSNENTLLTPTTGGNPPGVWLLWKRRGMH